VTSDDVLVRDESNAERKAGWKPGSIDSTLTVTLGSSHILQTVFMQNTTAQTVEIPAGLGEAGDIIQVLSDSTEAIVIAPDAGVTLKWIKGGESQAGARGVAIDSVVTLFCSGINEWKIWGTGIS